MADEKKPEKVKEYIISPDYSEGGYGSRESMSWNVNAIRDGEGEQIYVCYGADKLKDAFKRIGQHAKENDNKNVPITFRTES